MPTVVIVIMLNVVMLSVIMLNVVMLIVVASFICHLGRGITTHLKRTITSE
jgi:hypothetical protein